MMVRAGLGPLGAVLGQAGVVAFQTAITSPDRKARWEIIVQGRAEAASGRTRPVPPALDLVPDDASAVLVVDMELVTGWEYSAAGATPRINWPQPIAKKSDKETHR